MTYKISIPLHRQIAIITEALLMGLMIECGSRFYVLDEGNDLCVVGRKYPEGEEVLLKAWEISDLPSYIGWCSNFTDEQLTVIGANVALNRKE